MDEAERKHQDELRKTLRDRLRLLEITEARYGYNCPPEIKTEIEDINEKLEAINQKIGLPKEDLDKIELQAKLQSIETIDISAKSLISWYSRLETNERERQAKQLYYGKYVRWKVVIGGLWVKHGRVMIWTPNVTAAVKAENFLHHPYNPGWFREGIEVFMLGKIAKISEREGFLGGTVYLIDCYVMET